MSDLKVWKDSDIDLSLLRGLKIAIIGYGSQGRAQALNLRDSGYTPLIGLKPGSKSSQTAVEDGFRIESPSRAVADADLIVILAPDHKHPEVFKNDLNDISLAGKTFVFAHAMSVHFGLVDQPEETSFVLVAPHGPGLRVREKYLENKGVIAFIAATQESSEGSLNLAAAYAGAIGCGRAGLIETSFADEAIGDIFGEQAVLCGGLAALLMAGYDTLTRGGMPPENAYLECLYQIDLIVDLIKKYGISGMYERISLTAAAGSFEAEPLIINDQSKKSMFELLEQIKSGKFSEDLIADYHEDFKEFNKQKKQRESLPIDLIAESLRKKLDI